MATNKDKQFNDLLDPAQGAETWKERYAIAQTNQDRMFKRFSDWYDALYAQIGRVPSPWRSKIYVPKLSQQTWTLMAKFLVLKPGFRVEVRDPDLGEEAVAEKAEKIQKKLEFDYDNHNFEESMRDKLFNPLLDAIVTGTGMAKVPWTVKSRKVYTKVKDQYDTIDLSKHNIKTIKEGFNDLVPVNIFNVFISPSAPQNLYDHPWIIIKEYKPIAELEAINEAEGKQIYKNLDKLNGKVSYDTYAAYDRARNRLLTNADPTDKTVRMVKIYECYEHDGTICTYAEGGDGSQDQGWTLLREQKNVYWHGKYPLVKFHVKKKGFQFWGEGIYEITYRLQAAYNDVVNHFQDAMNVAYDPMLIAPESANVDDYVIEPAGLVQYRGDVAPTPFRHVEPRSDMLQVPLTLFDQAIEGVTISQYATGVPNDQADTTKGTATGIMRLQQAAGDVVTFFTENFKQSILQIGRMWLSNNQQFMVRNVNVTINKPDGQTSMKITPEDMQGDIDLTIDEASMEPLTQEDKLNQANAFINQITAIQNQSIAQNHAVGTLPLAVDWTTISEYIADQYNLKGFSKVLIPQQQLDKIHQTQMKEAAQHMVNAQQQAAAPPPQEPKSLAEELSIKFTDLPDDAQAAVLQQLGLPANQPTQSSKAALVKGLGAVTNSAKAGHGMAMDKINAAHQLAQSQHGSAMDLMNLATQHAQAQQQAMQPPQPPTAQGAPTPQP